MIMIIIILIKILILIILNEEGDEKNKNKRKAIDYTGLGQEINLNELIFEDSESEDAEKEAIERKNKIKLAFTRVKAIRRFNRLKSLNYNIKQSGIEANHIYKGYKSKKNVLFKDLDSKEEIYRQKKGRLKTIANKKRLFKLDNFHSRDEYDSKNDDQFLYHFLFSYIDY